MYHALRLAIALLVLTLSTTAYAQTQPGFLRVIHAAPTTSSINVAVEGQGVISDLAYGQQSQAVQVGAGYGFLRIDIVPTGVLWDGARGPLPSIASIDLSFAPGQTRTIQLVESAAGVRVKAVDTPSSPALPQTGIETQLVYPLATVATFVLVSGLWLRRRAGFRQESR